MRVMRCVTCIVHNDTYIKHPSAPNMSVIYYAFGVYVSRMYNYVAHLRSGEARRRENFAKVSQNLRYGLTKERKESCAKV